MNLNSFLDRITRTRGFFRKNRSAAVVATIAASILFATMKSETDVQSPWEAPPPELSRHHVDSAKSLAHHLRRSARSAPLEPVMNITWNRKWHTRPIGNLDEPTLRSLLVGNYFVYRTESRSRQKEPDHDALMSLGYFAPNGILWLCRSNGVSTLETTLHPYHYRLVQDLAGAATYSSTYAGRASKPNNDTAPWASPSVHRSLASDSPHTGRPIIYDPTTGTLAVHYWNHGRWHSRIGHVQREFVREFGRMCSEIPRNPVPAQIASTLSRTYDEYLELGGNRLALRNLPVLFFQDATDPLVMGMYFSVFPPSERS